MEYITPKYEQQLTDLAQSLVTPERYAAQTLIDDTIEFDPISE